MAIESGLFPLFEAECGEVVDCTLIRRQVPVEQYLTLQGRFKHLFSDPPDTEVIKGIQAIADANIKRYGLVEKGLPYGT